MKKVLFWDFDGTLSYPNKSFSTALYWALCKNGYSVEENAATKFFANVYSWKTPEISYPDRTNEHWWGMQFEKMRGFLQAHGIHPSDMTAICEDCRKKLIDVSNYKLYDDTVQTLEACIRKGYINYLTTNNYPEILENLTKLGIADFFSGYIVSSHIGYEKPRREFYAYAKSLAGDPDVGYMIGDNPVADIAGGKAAGLRTIAVHACKASCADHYFEELNRILAVL